MLFTLKIPALVHLTRLVTNILSKRIVPEHIVLKQMLILKCVLSWKLWQRPSMITGSCNLISPMKTAILAVPPAVKWSEMSNSNEKFQRDGKS